MTWSVHSKLSHGFVFQSNNFELLGSSFPSGEISWWPALSDISDHGQCNFTQTCFSMIVCVHIIFRDFNAFFVFVVFVNEGNSECFVQNSREPWKGFNRGKIKNKICLSPLSFYDHLVAEMPTSQDLKFPNFVISVLSVFSYQINYH